MAEELWKASAVELAAGIRDKRFSCVEVMTSVVERIRAVNPTLNAIVVDRSEQALAEAAADRAHERRRARSALRRARDHQGERRSGRRGDDKRPTGLRDRDRACRCAACAASASRRRDHRRPHQHPGSLDACDDGESAARPHDQSVASGGHARRLVRRRWRRRRRRLRSAPPRQRHRRLAPISGLREWRRDGEADAWPRARVQSVGDGRTRPCRAADVGAGTIARTVDDVRLGTRVMAQPIRAIHGGCRCRSTACRWRRRSASRSRAMARLSDHIPASSD